MAKKSGTDILTLARDWAQDNDSASNFAVGAAEALRKLNLLLMDWSTNVGVKPKYLAASTTGLTYTSGTATKETDGDPIILGFESFHPNGADTLAFPVSPSLQVVSIDEIMDRLGYDGDNALTGQASEWTHVAWEKTQDSGDEDTSTEKWRVWCYPVINRTRYLTAKATVALQISAIGKYPDLDEGDAILIARLLAWEIARAKKDLSQAFVDSIISPVPRSILDKMHRGGVLANELPSRVEWRE